MSGDMHIKVLLPTRKLLDEPVTKIVAEGTNGSFALLPRHVDVVAALVPGVLTYTRDSGEERIVGIDAGILVKCEDEVLVSVRRAMQGDDLASLRERIEREFRAEDERQRLARSAVARLEAGVVRRFIQFEE